MLRDPIGALTGVNLWLLGRAASWAAAGARRLGAGRRRRSGLNLGPQSSPEAGLVEPRRVAHASLGIDRGVVESQDRVDKLLRAPRPEAPGDAVDDRLQRPAAPPRDHRPARGLTLDCRDPELLDRGHDQRAGALEDLGDGGVGSPAGEFDGRPGELTQPLSVRAVADDDQR